MLCAAVIDIRNPVCCDCIINEIRICPAVQLIYARVHLHDSLSAARARGCIIYRQRRRRAQTACEIHLSYNGIQDRELMRCICITFVDAQTMPLVAGGRAHLYLQLKFSACSERAAAGIYILSHSRANIILYSCCLMCSKALCI